MRQELQPAIALARTLPADALPSLLGELEEIRIVALARALAAPVSATAPDQLLEIPEAAARLSVSPSYLYRRSKRLPFIVREGRKVLCSSRLLADYIRRKSAK
jgi:hypothetical protein